MRPYLFENGPTAPRSSSMLRSPCLCTLKRLLPKLRNAALPVADISAELMRLHEELSPKELRAYFCDTQDHVSRLRGLIDGMSDMLTTAMQVSLALVGNNPNEVVKRVAG